MPFDPTEIPPGMATADPPTGGAVVTEARNGGSEEPGAFGQGRSKAGNGYRWVIEWVVILLAVLLCTVLLRSYVVQTFYIPSPSMVPTLQVGDRIMVNKLSYDLHGVHRGDIVVFKRPLLEEQNFPDLVKRVVGLPGETISSQNGHIYINGRQLDEPWLPPTSSSYTGALPGDQHPQFNLPGPVTIPAGHYFVMGDNRTDSEDSRFFGPIPGSLIVGRSVAVVWPFSHSNGVRTTLVVVLVAAAALAIVYLVLRLRESHRAANASARADTSGSDP